MDAETINCFFSLVISSELTSEILNFSPSITKCCDVLLMCKEQMFLLSSFYYHFLRKFWLTDANLQLHDKFVKRFFGRSVWECAWKAFVETFEEGSMLKSKMRLLGMSALVGAGLVAATSASPYTTRLGGIAIQVDPTISVGSSMAIAYQSTNSRPATNGCRA